MTKKIIPAKAVDDSEEAYLHLLDIARVQGGENADIRLHRALTDVFVSWMDDEFERNRETGELPYEMISAVPHACSFLCGSLAISVAKPGATSLIKVFDTLQDSFNEHMERLKQQIRDGKVDGL